MSLPTRSLASLGAAIAVASLLVPAGPAAAVDPGTAAHPADAAARWLADELVAKDGMLTISFGGPDEFADHGLTIDAVLALLAAGAEDHPAVDLSSAALAAELGPYVTGFSPNPDDRAANAVAKALLLERATGTDVSPTYDLDGDLRSLMETAGDDAGRFSDTDSQGFGNFANGIGQALAVLALDRTPGGVPDAAVDFLLRQQCDDGSFRLYHFGYVLSFDPFETVDAHDCEDPAEGDADATAFALQALLVLPSDAEVATAVDMAVTYLLGQQEASGGFLGTGAVNSNTTGLAAAALRASGEVAAADAAAGFLAGLQLSTCVDFGALAYDGAALAAGIAADRGQWTRATAQGALGLGLPAYGGLGAVAPVAAGLSPLACPTGSPPGPPTLTASAGQVEAGGTVTLTATGFASSETVDATLHSTPRPLGSFLADDAGRVVATVTIPADLEPGEHRIELVGRSSGARASVLVEVTAPPAVGSQLPRTGAASLALSAIGLGLVASGAVLVAVGRRRPRPGPPSGMPA